MKILQPFGSLAASGSIGGSTYSRNRYGAYVRSRVVPVNPQSALQAAVRSTFSELVARWSLLTPAQRTAWSEYAAATPRTDALGQPITLTGRAVFIGNNALRIQSGLAVVQDGPTTFTLPELTTPELTITAGDPISVAFTAADAWTTPTGGGLSLFVTPAKSPQTEFCKGPYRYAGTILGAATSPSSPATISTPFVYASGARVFYRMVAMTADGRISSPSFGSVFCGA
jgi:hypothetical protein